MRWLPRCGYLCALVRALYQIEHSDFRRVATFVAQFLFSFPTVFGFINNFIFVCFFFGYFNLSFVLTGTGEVSRVNENGLVGETGSLSLITYLHRKSSHHFTVECSRPKLSLRFNYLKIARRKSCSSLVLSVQLESALEKIVQTFVLNKVDGTARETQAKNTIVCVTAIKTIANTLLPLDPVIGLSTNSGIHTGNLSTFFPVVFYIFRHLHCQVPLNLWNDE